MTSHCITITNSNGIEEIIFSPYNENNIFITEHDILKILNQFNVKIDKINNMENFYECFVHKSYCKKEHYPSGFLEKAKLEINNPNLLELQDNSYERLEYLGDKVLKHIVSTYLFKRYPKADEGFMTRLQSKIEDKINLAIMSKKMGLGKYFIISKQIELINNGRNSDKIHEDVFESFLAALDRSNGFYPCQDLIVNLLETTIDYSEKLYRDNNYKDLLLRIFHQKKWPGPTYVTIKTEGMPHKRKYIMGVENKNIASDDLQTHLQNHMDEQFLGYGIGNSKKEGEQKAAKMTLILLGQLNKDQYNSNDIYYPSTDDKDDKEFSDKSI